MIINWFGQSCFKIQGENSVLITDPLDKACGLKVPRLAADIVTISHQHPEYDLATVKGMNENPPFIIDGPGEYEVRNIFIYGLLAQSDSLEDEKKKRNIIYRFEIEGISIAHLGSLIHPLGNGQIEKLEGVDILMIPVGGTYTLSAKQATEVISQLEPRIIIPMNYNLPGLKLKHKIDGVNAFCKEIGVCPKEEINKFKVSKKDLPAQDLQVVVLQP